MFKEKFVKVFVLCVPGEYNRYEQLNKKAGICGLNESEDLEFQYLGILFKTIIMEELLLGDLPVSVVRLFQPVSKLLKSIICLEFLWNKFGFKKEYGILKYFLNKRKYKQSAGNL